MTIDLPVEIVEYIIDFQQGIQHRENMKKLQDQLIVQGTIHQLNSITIWDVKEIFDEQERFNMFCNLYFCNCCLRHQKNKPSFTQYVSGFVPSYSNNNNNNIDHCKCACRHLCRFLCRENNDEFMIEIDGEVHYVCDEVSDSVKKQALELQEKTNSILPNV